MPPTKLSPQKVFTVMDAEGYTEDITAASKEEAAAIFNEKHSSSYMDAAIRGGAKGATYNFSDEIAGGLASATGIGGDFGLSNLQSNIDRERVKESRAAKQYPNTYYGSEIAGAVFSPVNKVLAPAKFATRGAQYLNYANKGAQGGALAGYGESTGDFVDNAVDTVGGGLLGAGFGTAVPGAMDALGAAARSSLTTILGGKVSAGMKRLAGALNQSNLTIPDVERMLREMGPPSTIADVSRATQELGDTIGMHGNARTIAGDFLDNRHLQQGTRIQQGALNIAGANSIGDLISQRSGAAKKFYDSSVQPTNLVNESGFSPTAKSLLDDAREEVLRSKIWGAGLAGMADNSMPVIQAVKFKIDDMIKVADRAGKTNESRILRNALGEILEGPNGVYKQHPDFKTANDIYSDASPIIDALEEIERVVGATPDTADITKRLFDSPNKRKLLENLFPSQQQFDDFSRLIKNESTFAETRRIRGGSQTTPRAERQAEFAGGGAEDIVLSVANNGLNNTIFGLVKNTAGKALKEASIDMAEELAPLMFSSDPAMQRIAFNALEKRVNAGTILNPLRPIAAKARETARRASAYLGGTLVGNQ
jgi:hypothetical protein